MRRLLREGALAAEAWAEMLACRARLRFPRLLGTEAWLRRELHGEAAGRSGEGSADVLLEAFRRALGASPDAASCLPRSLALRRYLARHGQPSRLGLGLKREHGRLRGHAWVEIDGRVVSGEAAFVGSFSRLETAREDHVTARREEG